MRSPSAPRVAALAPLPQLSGGRVGNAAAGARPSAEVREVGPGAAIVKPRGVPHAFWNAGDAPARILEVITPAGFEGYFAEAAAIFSGDGPPDPARMGTLLAQYRLQMDLASIPELMRAHGLAGA